MTTVERSVKRVAVVTGAAGFIGHWFVQKLLCLGRFGSTASESRQYDVVIAVDHLQQPHARIKEKRFADLARSISAKDDRGLILVRGDIGDALFLTNLCKEHCPEAIFHLAGEAQHPQVEGVSDPFREGKDEAMMHCVLEAALTCNADVLFTSDAAVYGTENIEIPCMEEQTLNPTRELGLAKANCEALCQLYSQRHKLKIACLRLFTVYGEGLRYPDAIPQRYIRAALKATSVIMGQEVHAGKDWIHVDDVLEVFVRASTAMQSSSLLTLNVGTGTCLPEAVLVKEVEAATGRKVQTQSSDKNSVTVYSDDMQASITRLKKVLDFSPRIHLKEGLLRVVQSLMAKEQLPAEVDGEGGNGNGNGDDNVSDINNDYRRDDNLKLGERFSTFSDNLEDSSDDDDDDDEPPPPPPRLPGMLLPQYKPKAATAPVLLQPPAMQTPSTPEEETRRMSVDEKNELEIAKAVKLRRASRVLGQVTDGGTDSILMAKSVAEEEIQTLMQIRTNPEQRELLLEAVFREYATWEFNSNASLISKTKWRAFLNDTGVLKKANGRRRLMNGDIDVSFFTALEARAEKRNGAVNRANHSASTKFTPRESVRKRRKMLQYFQFKKAMREVAFKCFGNLRVKHLDPGLVSEVASLQEPFEKFVYYVLLPLAARKGLLIDFGDTSSASLRQGGGSNELSPSFGQPAWSKVRGTVRRMSIEVGQAQANRDAKEAVELGYVRRIIRKEKEALDTIFRHYALCEMASCDNSRKVAVSSMTFNELCRFGSNFGIVPAICSLSELLLLFREVRFYDRNVGDVAVLTREGFDELLCRLALEHCKVFDANGHFVSNPSPHLRLMILLNTLDRSDGRGIVARTFRGGRHIRFISRSTQFQ
eukprot:g2213.t1